MNLCPSRFRLLVFAAVLSIAVTGRADLTQAQMAQAVVDGLKAYATYSTGEDYVISTWPYGDPYGVGAFGILGDMLIGQPFGTTGGREETIGSMVAMLYKLQKELDPYFRQLSTLSSISNELLAISDKLDRAYFDVYKTAVTNTCQVINDWFDQYITFSGRVTNDLGVIRQRFDRNLSDLDDKLLSIQYSTYAMSEDLFRLVHDESVITERIDEVLWALSVIGGSLTNEVLDEVNRSRTILEDVKLTLDDNYDLLYYIEQHTDDAVEGIAGIYHELEDGLFNIFAEAIIWAMNDPAVSNQLYDIDYRPNLVEILNHLMAIEDCVSNIYADIPPILSSIDTNTLYTVNAVTNWYPLATNYYGYATNFFDDARDYFAKMLPRDSDLLAMYEITNSLRTNAVFEADFYDSETNRLEEELEDLEPDLDDYLTENPWDQADGWIEGVGDDVTEGLEVDNISWTDNLILFGSWDRRSDVVPLPRIEVDMGDLFESYPALRGVSGIVRSLWTFCGVFFRLILLFRFLDWFAKRRKG